MALDLLSTMRYQRLGALALAAGLLSSPTAAGNRTPGFHEQNLDLPGMPAAVLPADMNGDGRDDLVVLVAYTGWDDVASTERVAFDDIDGLVEVMNVVTARVDRRELRVYPARADGPGFGPPLAPLELDTSIHALNAAPARAGRPALAPLLAITDGGVAAARLIGEGEAARLSIEPLLEVETSLAASGTFFAELEFLRDLDGDGTLDLLLPIPPAAGKGSKRATSTATGAPISWSAGPTATGSLSSTGIEAGSVVAGSSTTDPFPTGSFPVGPIAPSCASRDPSRSRSPRPRRAKRSSSSAISAVTGTPRWSRRGRSSPPTRPATS